MKQQPTHDSVLLHEAVEALNLRQDAVVIDGTFGRGGHSQLILEQLNPGRLVAFDKDPEAIRHAGEVFASNQNFEIFQRSFADIKETMSELKLNGAVTGVLLDLGVSSPQLDQGERGFSFSKDGPLDMRMNPDVGQSAAQWLAHAKEYDIRHVLKVYGEERFASRIARRIVETREEEPLISTLQLAKLIDEAVPKKDPGKHPATRSFQGIRIFINQELKDLEVGLEAAFDVLAIGGRLVVISFHSLEDRIVKRFFKKLAKGDDFPKDLPVLASQLSPQVRVIGKPTKPDKSEVSENVRSRSAIMRVAEKL